MLFDFDGVLADTEPLHYACWKELLEPHGIVLDWPFYQRNCIGVSDRAMVEALASQANPPVPFERIWPDYQRKQLIFRERLEREHPFLPETISLIEKLHGDYRLAVVSSSARTEVEPPIERAGMRPFFQTLICGREAGNLKPAPDPYLKAAQILTATRPLVIEDSDAGVASATAAGFDVLRVSSAQSVPEELIKRLSATDTRFGQVFHF